MDILTNPCVIDKNIFISLCITTEWTNCTSIWAPKSMSLTFFPVSYYSFVKWFSVAFTHCICSSLCVCLWALQSFLYIFVCANSLDFDTVSPCVYMSVLLFE